MHRTSTDKEYYESGKMVIDADGIPVDLGDIGGEKVREAAERVERIAESTSWTGDRLTVNGKTSPPLTGPKGADGTVKFDSLTEAQKAQLKGEVTKSQLDTAIASEKARTVGMVWMVETEDAAKAKLSSAQAGDHIQVSATGNVYRLAQEGGVLTLKLVKSPITEIPGLVDFNTFTTTGVWHQGSYNNAQSSKNTPNNLPGLLEVFAASGTIYQRFTTYRGGDVYVRGYYAYADIWSDWRTLTN